MAVPTGLNVASFQAPGGVPTGGLFPTPELQGGPAWADRSLDSIIELARLEVQAGLPNETDRLTAAQKNEDFYELRNLIYLEKREAETDYDFEYRPKRYSKLTRAAIDALTDHLYSPGPARRLADAAANQFLQKVYRDNQIDTLMHDADRLAHLNDCAAIQVSAGETTPIVLHVFGSAEFAVWCADSAPTIPVAVATITSFDCRRRYQIWTQKNIWTFYTKKLQPGQTAGGVAAFFEPSESGPNPYGTIPFVFIHNAGRTRQFWGSGIGSALADTNHDVDRELSDLAQAVQTNACPPGFLINVSSQFRLTTRPGSFQHLPSNVRSPEDMLGPPEAKYVQAELNVDQVWLNIEKYINATLQELGVPLSSIRMEQQSAASGASIVAEQLPLLTRCKKRQKLFTKYEIQLASKIFEISAAWHGSPEIDCERDLEVVWQEPGIPLPSSDRDASDKFELEEGLVSRTQLLMQRRGISRELAEKQLEQIAQDLEREKKLFGALVIPEPAPEPTPDPSNPSLTDQQDLLDPDIEDV